MKKKSLLLAAFVVAAIIAFVVWNQFLRTAPSMKRLSPEFEVNAVSFYEEFETDETAANTKYLNKIVEVEGEVEGLNHEGETKPQVSLRTSGFGVVKCTLESSDSEAYAKLKTGDKVVIRGECIGILLDLLIERSIILSINAEKQ